MKPPMPSAPPLRWQDRAPHPADLARPTAPAIATAAIAGLTTGLAATALVAGHPVTAILATVTGN